MDKTAPSALALPKPPIGGGRPLNGQKSESDPFFFTGPAATADGGIGQGKRRRGGARW